MKLRHWIKVSRTEFQAHGQMQPSRGVPQCRGLPLSEVSVPTTLVASLLLSRKTQTRYSLRDLMSRQLSLPNFCICFLPCKPSSSFQDGGQKGAQRGLCSRVGIRWWCLQGHVNPPWEAETAVCRSAFITPVASPQPFIGGKGSSQHSRPQGLVAQSSASLFYFLSLYFVNLLPRLLSAG